MGQSSQTDSITNANGASFVRDPYGTLVAMRVGDPASYYYLFDGDGSVIKLVGSAGDVVASYLYCPTGNLAEPGSGQFEFTNPYRKYGAFYDWRYLTYWMGGLQYDANSGNARQLAWLTIGLGGYQLGWDLGPIWALGNAVHAMTFFVTHPNSVFPFPLGDCGSFIEDEVCNIKPVSFASFYPTPVKVTSVTSTSFTFTALAGHFDPVGSTITFMTSTFGGDLFLSQTAVWGSTPLPGYELLAFPAIFNDWRQQAQNLGNWLQIIGPNG